MGGGGVAVGELQLEMLLKKVLLWGVLLVDGAVFLLGVYAVEGGVVGEGCCGGTVGGGCF